MGRESKGGICVNKNRRLKTSGACYLKKDYLCFAYLFSIEVNALRTVDVTNSVDWARCAELLAT